MSCFRRYRYSGRVRAAALKAYRKRMAGAAKRYNAARSKASAKHQAYMAKRVASYTATKQLRACEHSAATMSCPSGYTIDMRSAFYGRSGKGHCTSGPIKTTACSAPKANSVVRAACQGKNSCKVSASNSVFDDPCIGTYKYMELRFRCKTFNPTPAVKRARAARTQKYKAQLAKLAKSYSLKKSRIAASYAKYQATVGRCAFATRRSDGCKGVRCGRTRKCSLRKQKFIGKVAYRLVCIPRPGLCKRVRCGRSQRCVVGYRYSRAVRSRVIKKIWKLLGKARTAHAKRVATAVSKHRSYLTAFARITSKVKAASPQLLCEHKSVTINCPAGFAIDILSAFYGRKSASQCRNGPIHTTNCSAKSAKAIAKEVCHGKKSCSVQASNSVFGDPCVGTFKYMELRYQCKSTGPTAAQARERSKRIRKHKRLLAALRRRHRRRTGRLRRGILHVSSARARCVRYRRKRSPCSRIRCRRGFVCVTQNTTCGRRRLRIARCVRPRALCSRRRCSKGTRCVVRRIATRAGRKFRLARRLTVRRYRSRRRSAASRFRKNRLSARAAFKRSEKAIKSALARAAKAKKAAQVKSLKATLARRRKSFASDMLKKRRNFKKTLRRLQLFHKLRMFRLSRRFARRRLERYQAVCALNLCSRVRCKAGYKCRHVRRYTKAFKTFLQQRRLLAKSYWAARIRLVSSLRKALQKSSKQLRKFVSSHRASVKKAKKTKSARRKLRVAFRRKLRGFMKARRASYRRYWSAVSRARRGYAKKLRALRQRHRVAKLRRTIAVARCIRKDIKSCRKVKCSAGKRCVTRKVPGWWYRIYRRSLISGNRKLRARLLRALEGIRRRNRRRMAKRRRAAKSFQRWFNRALKQLGMIRRRVGKKSKSRATKTASRRSKSRSQLWGRYKRAAGYYRKKFRRVVRSISRARLLSYARSRRRLRGSVFGKFKRNARKYTRRIASLKRRVSRATQKLRSTYSKAKKSTSAEKKKLKEKIVKVFRKIRKAYRRSLMFVVVSYYKSRVSIARSLRRRLGRFHRLSNTRRSRRRRSVIRRSFCIPTNPCRRTRCKRGYRCQVRKVKSKKGRISTVGRCEKKTNSCSKVKCSKGKRCAVRWFPTRANQLYRLYARITQRRFRQKTNRLLRRLNRRRRRQARRALRKYRKLRRSATKKLRGKKLSRRIRALNRSLRLRLRRNRMQWQRASRRVRARLGRRYRLALGRFFRRVLKNRRRYAARAVCVKRQTNPCSKKRCPSGSRCVARRRRSPLYRRFRRAVRRHLRRYALAKRRAAKLSSRRKRRAALGRLRRSLKRRLRKVWRLYKWRGAFRRTGRPVAVCARKSRKSKPKKKSAKKN